MAQKIKGITIEIGGDTTKLDKALGEVNSKSRFSTSKIEIPQYLDTTFSLWLTNLYPTSSSSCLG